MTILFTSAGRRSYLLHYFREALNATMRRGAILAVDMSPFAPALSHADRAFVVPSIYDPSYLEVILSIVEANSVNMVIPLNDLELPLLARAKCQFEELGAVVVVSSPDVVEICFDKYKTLKFLNKIGLRGPKTYFNLEEVWYALEIGQIDFPLVVKPRWGSASINVEFPQSKQELELAYELVHVRLDHTILAHISKIDRERAVIIQEHIKGPEYGMDIINGLRGEYVATFVKEKLGMRSGETDRAITVSVPRLESTGRLIGEKLAHIGNLDCDAFLVDGEPIILEMNPRFGGGYPFSHIAGANVPAALISWVSGSPIREDWLSIQPGVAASKFDQLVRVDFHVN